MAAGWSVSSLWSFHDTEQVMVSAELLDGRLVVKVEEKLTADQWRGQFDQKHIEELTRKTGNFKQFSIFLNMLESAITKSSESVSLDLLTYSDLEMLRNSKLSSSSSHKRSLTSQHSDGGLDSTHTKRYLILTYSTAFDRVHYPLALPYNGQCDPAVLKNIIRGLSKELERYKKLDQNHSKQSSIAELQEQYDILLQEKEDLQEAYDTLQQELSAMNEEPHSNRELRMLKKLTQTLEEDLLRERSKHQRVITKKNQEIKRLYEELEESKTDQRMLSSRVKALTSELAMIRREGSGVVKRRHPSPAAVARMGQRRGIMGRKAYQPSPSDRRSGQSRRGMVYRNTASSRSPSPGGRARFDPSAYVESRRKRQQEIASKIKIQRTPPLGSGGRRSRSVSIERQTRPPLQLSSRPLMRSRSSSAGSKASSRCSSVDSTGSRGSVRNLLKPSQNKGVRGRRGSGCSLKDGGCVRTQLRGHVSTSTPKTSSSTRKYNESSLLDQSVEMEEIDARLLALQRFMKRSLENVHTRNTGER